MLFEPKSALITGGCGFIGSNFINFIFDRWPRTNIVNVDKLLSGSRSENVDEKVRKNNRYRLVIGDLQDRDMLLQVLRDNKIDTVVHFAAITHVDDSYYDRLGTIAENVLSTTVLLEVLVHDYQQLRRFIHISTDEVYGDSADETTPKSEKSSPNPTNPYAASKVACEAIIMAYHYSYKLPHVMVRMNNVYGPRQGKSKLIPKFTTLAIEMKPYPLMGDGKHIRNWIYVDDCSNAIVKITENGILGQVYNIGTDFELENIQLTHMINREVARQMNRKEKEIEFAKIPDRPYHDRRYCIDFSKIQKQLDWSCMVSFEDGLKKTVEYYLRAKENEPEEITVMNRTEG